MMGDGEGLWWVSMSRGVCVRYIVSGSSNGWWDLVFRMGDHH